MPNLDYFIIGEGNTILFLHGWGQNKEMMYLFANKLKNKYKCLFLDMPGFGNSEFNNEKDMDEYVANIHDFITNELKLNPKYIVGHSFGGKVAIHYYLKYGYVKGICLIASPIIKPRRGIKYYREVYLYKLKKKLHLIKGNEGSNDYKDCNENMKPFFIHVVNNYYNKRIKDISIPLLLIYSKEDEKVEFKNVRKLENINNKSHLRVIKGDHFAYLNNENIISIEINNFIKEIEKKNGYYL